MKRQITNRRAFVHRRQVPASFVGKIFAIINSIPRVCYRHKWKTIIVILLFYFGRKAWNIYNTWIRPFMDVARQMKGGVEP